MVKKLKSLIVAVAAVLTSGAAQGQDVFSNLWRERRDEHRLRHDYRVLHRDMAHGNTTAVQYDQQRIRQDQAQLARDQAQLVLDRNGGRPISPSAINPGLTSAVPGQSYLAPGQSPTSMFPPVVQPPAPAVLSPNSLSTFPPLNPSPVPQNPVPGSSQKVTIANPTSTGVTLNFVFAGQTYSIDPGRTQEFSVTTPTLLIFNRGGQAGVARYTVTGGNTFEFKSDSGGWYVAPKLSEPADLAQNSVPPNPPLAPVPMPASDAATSSLPPLGATSSRQ